MMNDIEANLLIKLDCFFVGPLQPQQVMKTEAPVGPARIPRVKRPRHGYPVKLQICVLEISKKSLNSIPVVGVRENPNLVLPRKLQGPIPRKARFRTLARATGVTDDQYLHFQCLR